MAQSGKPHAIIISIPHQGHISPFIDLALKLASKGFGITFVNLEFVHHLMSESHSANEFDLFYEARKSGLDVRYTTIGDGFPLEFDRVLHLEDYWESMLRDFQSRVDELVGKIIQSDPHSVHFLVADALYTWPATVARKYNLVNVLFWTEPPLVFSLIYHSELLREKGHFPSKDDMEDEINYLPGIGSINTKDFMPYLKEREVETTAHKVVLTAFKEVSKADFILHNTVYELESETLSALDKYQPHYAIGPVYFSTGLPSDVVRKTTSSESDCTQWLDSKPPRSVLYVSFGSVVQTSKQVIEEIAYGLLLSEVYFIWVVRAGIMGSDDANGLPDGFVDEVKDRGLIIPWCNQMTVLSNPAVGGFLTHCGWNSMMESMWCRVPMICYPINYDQPTNRKLAVDDWKIGISLCDGTSVHRKEVAEKIRRVVGGAAASKGMGREIMNVRALLQNAVEIGGSSERNFDRFIQDLKTKIDSTTIE